jgi:hypothetical protein
MWLSAHERREARSRAPEYARYYVQRFGQTAALELSRRIASPSTSRYYRHLYRLALAHVKVPH